MSAAWTMDGNQMLYPQTFKSLKRKGYIAWDGQERNEGESAIYRITQAGLEALK